MLVDQRRSRILEIIEMQGFSALQDLVSEVGVSESTIRRDLEILDRSGQIRRTRGGAAYIGESLTDFDERRHKARTQKQLVARTVSEMIHSGETVLLDGGTTTLEVAKHLQGKSLQVVTNSLPIVNVLLNQPKIELIQIGGFVYPKTGVALGALAVEALGRVHARRLIMSVGGITERGLFNSNALLVETERAMMSSAEEVIVVTDSGKLGHAALARLCSLEDVDHMVVDGGISHEWRDKIESAGVGLTVVDLESADGLDSSSVKSPEDVEMTGSIQ